MRRLLIVVLLGGLILTIMLPNSPAFRPLTTGDAGAYLYSGQQILQGKILYRDIWDHKGPLVYYLNALGLFLGGGSRWGVWFIEWVFIVAASHVGGLFFRQAFGVIPALFASGVWLASLALVLDGGNLTEEYALLFQLLALYLFWEAQQRQNYGWTGFLIGVTAGLAFLLRPNLIGVHFAIVLYLLMTRGVSSQLDRLVREIGVLVLGAATVLVPVLLYFIYQGALNDLVDQLLRFNFAYSSAPMLERLKGVLMGMWVFSRSGASFVMLAGWVVGVGYLIGHRDNSSRNKALLAVAIIGWPLEMGFSSLSGGHPAHYYMAWLPVMAVLVGWFASYLLTLNETAGRTVLCSMLVGMLLLPAGVTVYQLVPPRERQRCEDIGWFLYPSSHFFECRDNNQQAVEYIRSHTKSEDSVLIWGFAPSINFHAQRPAPSRYFYLYQLFMTSYRTDKMLTELLQDIRYNEPVLIIDAAAPFFRVPPLAEQVREKFWRRELAAEEKELIAYINQHYNYTISIGEDEWDIYVRR